MKLVTVAEMQAIEREANAKGLTYDQMMENAGLGLAETVADNYDDLKGEGVLGLVGSGNNGGDTLVALAELVKRGWMATAYLVRPRPKDDPLITRLEQAGGKIYRLEDDPERTHLETLLGQHAILLDGVLGTGIRLPLKPALAEVLDQVRKYVNRDPGAISVVAVDCPSGVDCDSGQAAPETIPAGLTVTMAAIKSGLLKFPAFKLVGEIEVVGIGLPENGIGLESWQNVRRIVPSVDRIRQILPDRPAEAHKGTFGTALIVAGSLNYTGAVLLSGESAYRIGAGLVTLAVPAPLHTALAGHLSEATWLPLPDQDGAIAAPAARVVLENLERTTAMLIGPGFGLAAATGDFMAQLLAGEREKTRLPPLVIDADGLKLLSRLPGWPGRLPAPAVLTPHPGEMSILTGLSIQEIQADRLGVAARYSQEWGHVLVLKGAFSVIAAPDGQAAVIPVASPALARAGTGDVLAGLITGLRAQGVEAFPAAMAGAWIHAQAGLLAADSLGNTASVLAGDVLRASVDVLSDLYRETGL